MLPDNLYIEDRENNGIGKVNEKQKRFLSNPYINLHETITDLIL